MGKMKRSRANNHMKNKNRLKAANIRAEEDVSDGMEDEIDKFHKNRDIIPLEDNDSDVEEQENPVFDLEGSENEDEGIHGQDDAMEEALSDKEMDDMVEKIEKQAKLMRQKRGIIDNEDEGEEEEESDEEKGDWGKRKKAYYAADEVGSSDEEEAALEEAEARRLQQKLTQGLRPEDFFQEDMDAEEDTLEQLVEKSEKDGKALPRKDTEVLTEKDSDVAPSLLESEKSESRSEALDDEKQAEHVTKDYSALSHEEKMQIVKSAAPEMIGLVNELREGLDELQNVVEPLLEKMKKWKYVTEEARNYAQMKHQLLIVYCRSIIFYLMLKAEKKSVCDHPVIGRLVETRQLLEKVKVIDERMKPQVEKFLSLDIDAAVERKKLADENKRKPTEKASEKPRKNFEASSQKQEFIGEESKRMLKELARLEEKAKRDSLLEQPKKGFTIAHRSNTALDDFEDEVAVVNPDKKPANINQVIAEAGKRKRKPKIISGDSDLHVREDLGERRRKHEMQLPGNKAERDEIDDEGAEKADFFEDDFYKEAKRMKLSKQAQAIEKNSREPVNKNETENPAVGKRHITYEMEKNRGLTAYRNKASKNPRKKYKTKHSDAVIRRKGQVREIRRATGPYGGEATGIRTNLSRSIRFT